MIAYPWGALFNGTMLVAAGVMCLVRHFLLEPTSPNYPKAPMFVRHGIFGFAIVLLFLGLQFLVTFFDSSAPESVPPQPGPPTQFLATALVIYKAILLGNILRQRYPSDVWNRLNRINEHLQCKNGTLFENVVGRFRSPN